MEDAQLRREVLELTLPLLQGSATVEERARLERLMSDCPRAIAIYLEVVDDTLTLCDAAAAPRNGDDAAGVSACAAELDELNEVLAAGESSSLSSLASSVRRSWKALTALACLLLVSVGLAVIAANVRSQSAAGDSVALGTARIVDLSNVMWAPGTAKYSEWSELQPGDTLKFDSGWINLFVSSGAELVIEGPADVDFVSAQNVYARQGKLAARVGPGAIGFRIDTPHAQVTDRGTAFGMSVDGDSHTSVVVYEGQVDLDVVGERAPPRRRLESGEALSVNRRGQLSRITTVESAEFLEPPKIRVDGAAPNRLIASVTDNVRSLETAKYYRVIPGGFREDCRAYVDRLHEWNGVDVRKLPGFLVGGDYVMTFNDDKVATEIQIAVSVAQPASVYVLIDDRVPPPAWLARDFIDTEWDVGCDEGWPDKIIDTGVGAGNSIDHTFSVWRRILPEPTTVLLGPLTREKTPPPQVSDRRSMYGIVVTALREAAT